MSRIIRVVKNDDCSISVTIPRHMVEAFTDIVECALETDKEILAEPDQYVGPDETEDNVRRKYELYTELGTSIVQSLRPNSQVLNK